MKYILIFGLLGICALGLLAFRSSNQWIGNSQFRREIVVSMNDWWNKLQPTPLYCEKSDEYSNIYFTDENGRLLRSSSRNDIVWVNATLFSSDTSIYMYYDKHN
jgi:hypothetical protein